MGLPKEIESKLDALTRAATLYFETGDALGMKAAYDAAVSAITHALAERDARIAELTDALRPFAAIADTVEPMVARGNMHPDLQTWVATGRIAVLTFSDCDRARALLAKGGGK